MAFEILDIDNDKVIDSPFITIKTTYAYALKNLYPLINQLEFQRNPLKKEYYERLREDIINGCIMPPITVAFDDKILHKNFTEESTNAKEILESNMYKGFILDGIQRLNTVEQASSDPGFDENRPMYASIILSDSMNKLLYRMIILNNGQRPMSARHQIEILVGKSVSKLILEDEYLDKIYTEKDARRNDGVNKLKQDILSKGFIAFSSSSVDIDNQKIIEEKLNEIISRKIVISNIKDSKVDLETLIKYILDLAKIAQENDDNIFPWLNNENNLIGLFAGISINNSFIDDIKYHDFKQLKENVEYAISNLKTSKIKVSKVRRDIVFDFTKDYEEYNTDNLEKIDDYTLRMV